MVNSVRHHGGWAEELQGVKILPCSHSQQQQFLAPEVSMHKENIFALFVMYWYSVLVHNSLKCQILHTAQCSLSSLLFRHATLDRKGLVIWGTRSTFANTRSYCGQNVIKHYILSVNWIWMLRIEDFPLLLGAKYLILSSVIIYVSQARLLFKSAFLVIWTEMMHVYQGRNVVITLMIVTAMMWSEWYRAGKSLNVYR